MNIHISNDIILEPLSPAHAGPVFDLIENNRSHLSEWLTWVERMQKPADFEQFVEDSGRRAAEGLEAPFVIRYQGEIAGRIGIYYINKPFRFGSIGYWLGEQFQGKGIIVQSCIGITDYGFNALGINRIEIRCATGNLKSRAVAERLGFRHEGIMRDGELLQGAFIDLHVFSMLKKEWEQR
ncbi:MAG TPA: GNAT family protein [Saprospiraceae bacterium]|nr:GNAT family protein [Saprospiraceae bacterium]